MWEFPQHYLLTLWNLWFWIAAGVLTLNEVAGKFVGRSWEWPREHRFKAVVIVLILSQVGAYKSLYDASIESRTESSAKASVDTQNRPLMDT
jgi:hypothetical protein